THLDLRTEDALIGSAQLVQTDPGAVPGLLGDVTGESAPAAGEAVLRSSIAARLGVEVGDAIEVLAGDQVLPVQVVGLGDSTSRTAALVGPGTLPDGGAEPVWFVTGDVPVTWADVVQLNEIGVV